MSNMVDLAIHQLCFKNIIQSVLQYALSLPKDSQTTQVRVAAVLMVGEHRNLKNKGFERGTVARYRNR